MKKKVILEKITMESPWNLHDENETIDEYI